MCQTVAHISKINQFHEFLKFNFWRIFAIWSHYALPDASQEGLLWPWKGYASVALFHFHVPEESTRATFEFASFQGLYDYLLTKDLLDRHFMFHMATCFDYLRYLT